MILLIIAVIFVFSFLIGLVVHEQKGKKELENITRVDFINRSKVYKEGFEHTGFSIGSNGHGRAYFGKRKRLIGIETTFYVTYSDKSPKYITASEGTKKFSTLMQYFEHQEQAEYHRMEETQKKNELKPVEQVTLQPTNVENPKKEKPKFLDIPFIILPNEFSIEISNQSCVYQPREYDAESYEVYIRFEIHYDSTVKGVTNRKVICALYDSNDRIFSTRSALDHLSKSGCQIVEINFWDNIYEEPAKVSIGVERYN